MKKNERSSALYVEDMIEAIEKVMAYTKGYDFAGFDNDRILKDAVLMNLQIVGEGANKMPKEIQEKYPQIPWRDMADFRIIVAHIYFKVRFNQVWDMISMHLPANLIDLKIILKEIEEQENKEIK